MNQDQARRWAEEVVSAIKTAPFALVNDGPNASPLLKHVSRDSDSTNATYSYDSVVEAIAAALVKLTQGQEAVDGLCKDCEGSGTQHCMTSHLGPDDYEYDAECETCKGTGSSDIRDIIKSLPYQPHTVKYGLQMIDRAEVLRFIDTHPAPSQQEDRKQWSERVAELERDRDDWKDATISGNTRFKMAEEKLASEREKTAELERVLGVARETIKYYASVCGEDDQPTPAKQAISTIDAARSKEGQHHD